MVATPIGLSFLLIVPLSIAAFLVDRRELATMTAVCIAARILFGPVGDPLGLRGVTLEVPPDIQVWLSTAFSVVTYVAVASTFHVMARQRRRISDLATQAERDPLTGCANRRALDAFLLANADKDGSVIVVDADHFKKVNDTHGHDAGDHVLRELARRLEAATRKNDLVARIGGEEFVLVLPGASAVVAERVSTRVLESIRAAPFDIGKTSALPVTVSAGCATGPLAKTLLDSADGALYLAKQAGRDRFVAAATNPSIPAAPPAEISPPAP